MKRSFAPDKRRFDNSRVQTTNSVTDHTHPDLNSNGLENAALNPNGRSEALVVVVITDCGSEFHEFTT